MPIKATLDLRQEAGGDALEDCIPYILWFISWEVRAEEKEDSGFGRWPVAWRKACTCWGLTTGCTYHPGVD